MRWVGLGALVVCGPMIASPAPTVVAAATSARRVVEVEVRVETGDIGPRAESVTARAWMRPVGSIEAGMAQTALNDCYAVQEPTRGSRATVGLDVTVGDSIHLDWNAELGRYQGLMDGSGIDPSWRNVTVATPSDSDLPLVVRDAVGFGGTPSVRSIAHGTAGVTVVLNPLAPGQEPAAEVAWNGGVIRCPGRDGTIVVPGELQEMPGAVMRLTVTTERSQRRPGGTLVVARAVVVQPLPTTSTYGGYRSADPPTSTRAPDRPRTRTPAVQHFRPSRQDQHTRTPTRPTRLAGLSSTEQLFAG